MVHIPPIGAIIASTNLMRQNNEEARKKREAILRTRHEKQLREQKEQADDKRN